MKGCGCKLAGTSPRDEVEVAICRLYRAGANGVVAGPPRGHGSRRAPSTLRMAVADALRTSGLARTHRTNRPASVRVVLTAEGRKLAKGICL